MQLVEKHVIDRNDPCFMVIDQAAFASKNLYNAALYLIRQSYIFEGKYLTHNQMGKLMKSHEAYKALLAKVSQQVLKQLAHDWESFFKANVLQALINILLTEESYTSKASFLDRDPLPIRKPNDKTQYTFSGKRVKRGLYRAANGREINADCNGSYNIIRKVAPDAFGPEGVEDGKAVLAPLVVHPVRIVIPLTKPKKANAH